MFVTHLLTMPWRNPKTKVSLKVARCEMGWDDRAWVASHRATLLRMGIRPPFQPFPGRPRFNVPMASGRLIGMVGHCRTGEHPDCPVCQEGTHTKSWVYTACCRQKNQQHNTGVVGDGRPQAIIGRGFRAGAVRGVVQMTCFCPGHEPQTYQLTLRRPLA